MGKVKGVADPPTMRPVEPTDTHAVGDVFLAAIAGMTYLPELYTEEETRTFIRDVLLPNNEVWVAEDGGRVIGFLGLWGDVVSHLWVHPDQQNQGVGTALLGLAMDRRPSGLRCGFSSRTQARDACTNATGSRSWDSPTVAGTRKASQRRSTSGAQESHPRVHLPSTHSVLTPSSDH